MFTINKITSHTTVDFAAEELKKYLRMMMPRRGEMPVAYAPLAQEPPPRRLSRMKRRERHNH